MNKKLFLSAVSSEFLACRNLLASDLKRPNLEVAVQEDIEKVVTGGSTLEKLDDYIRHCDGVVHLTGKATGEVPDEPAVAALLARYPDFATRLPPLDDFVKQPQPGFSYTQWEAYLALYHGRPLYVYRPTDFELDALDVPRSANFVFDPAQAAAQKDHYQRICDLGHDRGQFQNEERLSSAVLRDLVEILPRLYSRIDVPPTKLPHTAGPLIGREPELAMLDEAWNDPHRNVVVVRGKGGEGKTSLVAAWMAMLEWNGYCGAEWVLDVSFYSQGTRDQGTASGEAFIISALVYFGDANPNEGGPEERGARLARLVGDRRGLLVLDGLEPLQYPPGPLHGQLHDKGVAALLKGLAGRSAGLCVVTTREKVDEIQQHYGRSAIDHSLEFLSPEAGAALLHYAGAQRAGDKYPLAADDRELQQASREVRGHALTLFLVGQYLQLTERGDIRRRDCLKLAEAEYQNDATRPYGHAFKAIEAYERWFAAGDGQAQRQLAILRLLGLFDRPATRDCLTALRAAPAIAGLTESLAGGPDKDWNKALSRLGEINLVAVKEDGSVDCHPLLREYFAVQLKRGTGFQPVKSAHGTTDHGQDGRATVRIRQGAYLPHWTREGGIYAVTFRLADSLPATVVNTWRRERDEIVSRAREQGRDLTAAESHRLQELFSERVERHLDAGTGDCWMRQPEIAQVVRDALLHFDGQRYRLLAWCVMPNHVHVVVRPEPGFLLENILHSWKSFSAKQANKKLNRTGTFWQPEYYDHLIRDEQDLEHAVEYVLNNPVVAGLSDWAWVGHSDEMGDRGTGFQPVETNHGQSDHGQDGRATSEAWQAGHRRLYEYLCKHKVGDAPTLEDLQPLYQAVAHGCQAGLQQEAFYEIFIARIQRGTSGGGFYSTNKLGAFGSDLGGVSSFFEQPWGSISSALGEEEQAWLLNQAAFRLRALGRLTEALEPMRAALEMGVKQQNWKSAAIRASNLSELEQTLGEVAQAERDAAQSVTYADRSGDADWPRLSRTTHADALHQAGRRAEAFARFREAEQMQAESQPEYPLLYSVQGFQYCDLLLTEAERAAWRVTLRGTGFQPVMSVADPSEQGANHGQDGRATQIARCGDVSQRAAQTLKWVEPNEWLLDIALDHLTLGRAALYAAILESGTGFQPVTDAANHGQDARATETASRELETAVTGLRRAGTQDYLPRGLLTRAWLRFLADQATGPDSAESDLDEAWEIAERGSMKLFLADIHLTRCRLFGMRNSECGVRNEGMKYPWESPAADLAAAEKLINTCGYHRRDEELADAKGHVRE